MSVLQKKEGEEEVEAKAWDGIERLCPCAICIVYKFLLWILFTKVSIFDTAVMKLI